MGSFALYRQCLPWTRSSSAASALLSALLGVDKGPHPSPTRIHRPYAVESANLPVPLLSPYSGSKAQSMI
jgi:hypothetical protein